jgi:hypothetical protein
MISDEQLNNSQQYIFLEQSLGLIFHMKAEDVDFMQRRVNALKPHAEGKRVVTTTPRRYSSDPLSAVGNFYYIRVVGNVYFVSLVAVVAKAEREIQRARKHLSSFVSAIPGNTRTYHEVMAPYDALSETEFLEYARKADGDAPAPCSDPEEHPPEVISFFDRRAMVPAYLEAFQRYKKRRAGRELVAQWKELLKES